MRITRPRPLALTLSAGPAAAQQKETETVDRTIAFSRGGTLKLKNFSGDVRVTGTSGNDVVIHAVRTATRDRLDNIKLDIQVNGSTITSKPTARSPAGTRRTTTSSRRASRSRSRRRPTWTCRSSPAISSCATRPATSTRTPSAATSISTCRGRAPLPTLKAETFSGDIKARVPAGQQRPGRVQHASAAICAAICRSCCTANRAATSTRTSAAAGGAKLEFKTFSGDLRLVK